MLVLRQAILGILAALISSGLVIGALALSLAERDLVAVGNVPATAAPTQVYPTPVILVDTPAPGEPTFTPSPSPEPSPTAGQASETPSCMYPDGWTEITVQAGVTLDNLAQAYGTTVEALRSGNCLPVDLLLPGINLFVPPLPTATATLPYTETPVPSATTTATEHTCNQPPSGWLTYTVRWGDTLSALARLTGTSVIQLKKANCLKSDQINTGQRLWVPRLPPTPIPSRTPTQIPTLPPTATVPPPTSPPPPTAIPPTIAPPTSAPSDTPIPPTEVPTEIPTTVAPPPTEVPTVVTTTEIPIPITEPPAGLAATPTPRPEAAAIPQVAEAPDRILRGWVQPFLFGGKPSIFAFQSRSVIIHRTVLRRPPLAAISTNSVPL